MALGFLSGLRHAHARAAEQARRLCRRAVFSDLIHSREFPTSEPTTSFG